MCGCEERRSRLNTLRPGLGDKVATVAEPIKKVFMEIQNVFAAMIGYIVADYLINRVKREQEALRKRVEEDARTAKAAP